GGTPGARSGAPAPLAAAAAARGCRLAGDLPRVLGGQARRARSAVVELMTTADQTGDTLVVRRVLAIARETVFAAWRDPASLAQWMRPGAVSHATVEVGPRVGGESRIVLHRGRSGGGDVEYSGASLAIEPP